MKKLSLTAALLLSSALPAIAQDYGAAPDAAPQSLTQVMPEAGTVEASSVMMQVEPLQKEWARIKYQVADKDTQLEAVHALERKAEQVTASHPDSAEAKIWEAIILSTDAGIVRGISALGKVEKAKDLLEAAIKIDPRALKGSAYTSLGSLYYQVPGWPVAFGDDEEAEKNLKQALQINPAGIDPNFFYGDFLMQDDRFGEAKGYLERALQAPDRPGRELADAGRRQEIKAKLAEIAQKGKDTAKPKYN